MKKCSYLPETFGNERNNTVKFICQLLFLVTIYTAQKMKFSLRTSFSTGNYDLVTFAEEILNGKLHFYAVLRMRDNNLFDRYYYYYRK